MTQSCTDVMSKPLRKKNGQQLNDKEIFKEVHKIINDENFNQSILAELFTDKDIEVINAITEDINKDPSVSIVELKKKYFEFDTGTLRIRV